MRILLFIVANFLIVFSVLSQNVLSGQITHKATSEPVFVTVHIPKLDKGAVTDAKGKYEILNIPDGIFEVVVVGLGFTGYSEKIQFENGENRILNIALSPSAIEIGEIVVSTGFHKLQSENVMKVEQISADKLERFGVMTIAQGLKNVPGVNVVSTGASIDKPVIRGLSYNRILTYAQGVRIENQQFGDEHGLGVNGAGIESVEVIKGPASLLYGSDAMGGVLYFNPEKFAPAKETHADFSSNYFTNTLGHAHTIGVQSSLQRFQFLARGSYAAFSDYKGGDDVRISNTRFYENDIKLGSRYIHDAFKSEVRYNYNYSVLGFPDDSPSQTISKKVNLPFQEIENHILSIDNTIYLQKSTIDLKVGYILNDRKEFEDESEDAELALKLQTLNYDVKYHFSVKEKFETIAGIQGMFQKNEAGGEAYLIPGASIADFGVFATTHYHLPKLDLQAGLRYDLRQLRTHYNILHLHEGFERLFNNATAAMGGRMDFSKALVGRLNLATGFRAPNLAELASMGVHEGTNRYERGSSSLKKEQNLQIDFSLEYTKEHVEVFANTFYNVIDNYIFLAPSGQQLSGFAVYDYLQQDATLYGGEAGFHIHPHPLDKLHFESSFEMVVAQLQNNDYLPLMPAHRIKNAMSYLFKDGKYRKKTEVFIALETTLNQNRPGNFESKTGGYTLLNTGMETDLSIKKVNLKIGISATNLTNKKYIAHLSRFKEEGYLNMGRDIKMSLKLKI